MRKGGEKGGVTLWCGRIALIRSPGGKVGHKVVNAGDVGNVLGSPASVALAQREPTKHTFRDAELGACRVLCIPASRGSVVGAYQGGEASYVPVEELV